MRYEFMNAYSDFRLSNPDEYSGLYMPITNQGGIMGSVTGTCAGDSKVGQHHFLLEPVSNRDLHTGTRGRNFWFYIEGVGAWSAMGNSALQQSVRYSHQKEKTLMEAGKLWQRVKRENKEHGMEAEVMVFSPATDEHVEIIQVTIKNKSSLDMTVTPTTAIPIYARSADNIRDHRHVTSLLNRMKVEEDGVILTPCLSFDERGHKVNHVSYGVFAREMTGERPIGCCPIEEDFIGEGGSLLAPRAISDHSVPFVIDGEYEGYEAIGAIRFKKVKLKPEESRTYIVLLSYNKEGLRYLDYENVNTAYKEMREFWRKKTPLHCYTKDQDFNHYMSWVGIQPVLRRIYGCSFLPHHDYGRGGRGWRDLWQDSLALLLSEPGTVREQLTGYFAGVRIDGTNATIIGKNQGEFIADRNAIVRVWMDHGFWPFLTTNLYIDWTGDLSILMEESTYFRDKMIDRGESTDPLFDGQDPYLKTNQGSVYKGSILEHLLIENLTAFYDVGEHNHIKLRGADWNDALDMAEDKGESVAFSSAYALNLEQLGNVIKAYAVYSGQTHIRLIKELLYLLNQSESTYVSVEKKQSVLKEYNHMVQDISGEQVEISLIALADRLHFKAEWMKSHIRKTEWLKDSEGYSWFNGYYDNLGHRVEGEVNDQIRMMLTSQVFSIISGTATDEQVMQITKSADRYLYDSEIGGYRLNTDFKELKLDFGRMFSFAYGHKENGAVFCHMAVMYAYGLYQRGFAKEGYKVLHTLYVHSLNFDKSVIYPGIPEYFNQRGRGMYSWLTGAGSWMVFAVLTEMFGVKGRNGNLQLSPKLMAEQFDENGIAEIRCRFADRNIKVIYINKNHKEIGDYEVEEIKVNNKVYINSFRKNEMKREYLKDLEDQKEHTICVELG